MEKRTYRVWGFYGITGKPFVITTTTTSTHKAELNAKRRFARPDEVQIRQVRWDSATTTPAAPIIVG